MVEKRTLTKAATGTAKMIIIGTATFLLFISVYYFYYYKWTHERCFIGSKNFIFYSILPLSLASLLFASLRLRLSYQLDIALMIVSIGGSFLFGELAFALLEPTFSENQLQKIVQIAKEQNVNFDRRSKLEVVSDFQQKDIDTVPAIPSAILLRRSRDNVMRSDITIGGSEIVPLGGIANKFTVLCNESGTYQTYKSDQHGFRNPSGSWNNNHIEVAALGDSFTQGFCVPSDKNFVALIRQQWPATLNLGNHGDGPLTMLATLTEYVQPLTPKVVLWFYFENDLLDLRREKDSPLLMRYLEEDFTQGLFSRQTQIDQALVTYVEKVKRRGDLPSTSEVERKPKDIKWLLNWTKETIKLSRIRNHLNLISGTLCSGEDDPTKASVAEIELFRAVLLKAQASVNTWGGTLYFVFLPEWQRYAMPQLANKDRERVLEVARNIGLPVIDLYPVFQAQADPVGLFPFRQDGHYTEAGHRLVAEEVLRALSRNEKESAQTATANQ